MSRTPIEVNDQFNNEIGTDILRFRRLRIRNVGVKNKSVLNAIQIARLYNPSVCDFLVGLFYACHDRFDFIEIFAA